MRYIRLWLPISLAAIGSLFWLSALIASYLVWQQGQVSVGPTVADSNDLATNTAYASTNMQVLIADFIHLLPHAGCCNHHAYANDDNRYVDMWDANSDKLPAHLCDNGARKGRDRGHGGCWTSLFAMAW